jgi:hypothetical protein
VRLLPLLAGIVLVAIAFGAATQVANTREGLIAEVITLLAGLAGISLVLYGVFARASPVPVSALPGPPAPARPPSAREFATGVAGLGLAAILIGGLAITAGWQWAALGSVVLLPMIVWSAYFCARFLRMR